MRAIATCFAPSSPVSLHFGDSSRQTRVSGQPGWFALQRVEENVKFLSNRVETASAPSVSRQGSSRSLKLALQEQYSALACSSISANFVSRSPAQLQHGRQRVLPIVDKGCEARRRAIMATAVTEEAGALSAAESTSGSVAVLINGGSGKMGQAVAQAAIKAGITVVPLSLAGPDVPQHEVDVGGVQIQVYGAQHRDEILDKALEKHPGLIIVDYTLPAAVNANAEWYCQRRVPFVMGTTGGDRKKLLQVVEDTGNYAVIAPQMGKQVVAFIAGIEALAQACPDAFRGYTMKVTESHQSTKVDTSGTAKEVVACFQRLGVDFSIDQIEMVREPQEQISRMKVPEEYLKGHAFHTYRLESPDGTVSFEFQHNVCGRSIYAEGTVDAVLFLANKIAEKAGKKLYNMIDVLRGGAMR